MNTTLEPWYGDLNNQAQPAVQPVKDGSVFKNISDSLSNLLTSSSNVITAIKNPGPGTPGYNPSLPASYPPPAPQTKTNYAKIALITLGIGTVGFVGYKLLKKKKVLNGVGDITAKTKSGKRKQTKAIFARLAEEGGSKPKRKTRRKKSTSRKVKI